MRASESCGATQFVERPPEGDHHEVAFVPEQLHQGGRAVRRTRHGLGQRRGGIGRHRFEIRRLCRTDARPVDAEHQVQDAPAFVRLGNEWIVHSQY